MELGGGGGGYMTTRSYGYKHGGCRRKNPAREARGKRGCGLGARVSQNTESHPHIFDNSNTRTSGDSSNVNSRFNRSSTNSRNDIENHFHRHDTMNMCNPPAPVI